MKTIKILLIVCLMSTLSANAQMVKHYKSSHKNTEICMYIPAVILVSTFAVNQSLGTNVSYADRSMIAVTGMASAVASYYIIKNIQSNRKHKRSRKFKY